MRNRICIKIITFIFASSVFAQDIELETFGAGASWATEITHAGDDRIFIAQKDGQIRLLDNEGNVLNYYFLNISSIVNIQAEMGLLGLAFDPDYQNSGKFYVHYNNNDGHSVIARYTVSEDPNEANPEGTILLTIENSEFYHKGGTIRFGPDGYLWIAIGDDGDWLNGQNINSLKGKILRIDVSGDTYTIPPNNPFVGIEGADEIWAYGLRNPWKFNFDFETGDIWIGDVGSILYEEINRSPASEPGKNYGWNCYEGDMENPESGCEGNEELTFPIAMYDRGDSRCAIIGGQVYRGAAYPNLFGKYLFADFCTSEIGLLDNEMNMVFTPTDLNEILTIGEDFHGNIYVSSLNKVYKIIDKSMGITEDNHLEISLLPNPTSDYIYINSTKTIDEVHIYSIHGKLLRSQKGKINQIDLSSFPKGVYLLTVNSGRISKTQKVIKN